METVTNAARGVTESDDCSETDVVAEHKIIIVGIGPGGSDFISPATRRTIDSARIVIGMVLVALDGKILGLDQTARRMGEELHWRL